MDITQPAVRASHADVQRAPASCPTPAFQWLTFQVFVFFHHRQGKKPFRIDHKRGLSNRIREYFHKPIDSGVCHDNGRIIEQGLAESERTLSAAIFAGE
jgi:hypothetical protein